MRTLRLAGVAVAALAPIFGASDAAADPHPNTAGGVAVAQAFAQSAVDNINLFNGNLTVTIPIGMQYPVSSALSYQLMLVENSNPWDYSTRFDLPTDQTYADSSPSHCSNAGLGWRVSLGTLGLPGMAAPPTCVPTDAPVSSYGVYEAPDGSQHLFYATLHPGASDPDDIFNGVQDSVATGVENVAYTRDGSSLRLKKYGSYSEIEFPDGTVHRFDANGRLVQMRDPINGQVNIAYPPLSGCTGALGGEAACWQISDSQGRTQWIYFRYNLPPYNGVAPYGGLVSRIVLTAFNGALATYTFAYQTVTVQRGCPMNDYTLGEVSVPVLMSVTQPDESLYAPGAAGYFEPTGAGCANASGNLISLTLPTLGRLGWTYQAYSFPTASSGIARRQFNYGVATRSTLDQTGAVIGAWQYFTSLNLPNELVNVVTDPLGNQDLRYFSVAATAGGSPYGPGANPYDYGRQYTPNTTDPANANLFLAEKVVDAQGNLRRTQYVRYERDLIDINVPNFPDGLNNNPRIAQAATVYDDGAEGGHTDTNYDGLGHYRTRTTDGTFAGNNVRVEDNDYNPSHGTYSVVQSSNTYSGTYAYLPPTSPWVLNTADFNYSSEGGVAELRTLCFDATTGHPTRRRVYLQSTTNPAAMSAADLLQEFVYDPSTGNLANELYFGGDHSPVTPTSSDICQQTLPAASEYQIDHGWIYGVNSVIQYQGAGFFSRKLGVDQSTGLPNYSRDTAGIQTNLTYDPMGRLVYVQPRDGAWTQYLYHPASSPTSLAALTVDRQQNGVPGTSLAQTRYFYDALGRMTEEDVRMPSGSFSARTTSYNGLGWKTAESQQGTPNANLTQFLGYDAFGRVGTIRPPDSTAANGFAHDVVLSYAGVQSVTHTTHVGTSWTGAAVGETASSSTEVHDRFGRLASVTEPSGSGGAAVTTSYAYDAGNRLTLASTTAAGTTQTRVLSYDRRGFLSWEVHPETAGNYLADGHHKDYLAYDSRGHLRRTVEGANDLSYTYDVAERPLLVYNTLNGANCSPSPITTPTCVKQFRYDNTAAGALGRLYQASRFNHILYGGAPNADEWTYTYTYQGLDGRLSQRSLQHAFNGSTTTGQESFQQSWTYTQLGQIDTETYPDCAPAFSGCAGTASRAVQNLYTSGFLTAVAGYTAGAGIAYYANGMVSSLTHVNGVTTTYGADPFGLPRPASITASGLWSSGAYAYDGSDNVVQVGHGYYLYDPVNRLTTAQVETNPVDSSNLALDAFTTQTTTYDAFGNIQSFPTNNATPTDPASNHLTSGTYDASGNLRTWNGPPPASDAATYDFDELNQLKHYKNGAQEWFYMYDADDQRVWSFQPPVNGLARFDRWSLRGLDGRVRRTFELNGYQWGNDWAGSNLWEDYIYRGPFLLASYFNTGVQRHMDVDHLGTPRLITNSAGAETAYHVYLPYGVEATAGAGDTERMKFTAQERDLADPASPADDLDYMHARFTNPITGRFLSVDAIGGMATRPQSLNRYSYGRSSPLTFVDPDGLDPQAFLLTTATSYLGGSVPSFMDLATHAAIYISDADAVRPLNVVFENGGRLKTGTGTLGSYLDNYGTHDTTLIYRLNLDPDQVSRMLVDLQDQFHLVGIARNGDEIRRVPRYDTLSNNCAQFVCAQLLQAESSSGIYQTSFLHFAETITVRANPLLWLTSDLVAFLYGGRLIDNPWLVPAGTQAIYYLSYYPPQ